MKQDAACYFAQAKPKMRFSCAFPETDLRAEGYKAFVNKNKKDIDAGKLTLVVADTLRMQLELLRDGYSTALTGQRPFEMGEKSMDILLAIKKGEKVPEIVYTGLDLVTKDNVAQMLK